MKKEQILINVPHSSTFIPESEEKFFRKEILSRELLVMTDHFTDDLFNIGFSLVTASVSRLVCDVERFRDDKDEIMSQIGMGAVYEKCSDGSALRSMTPTHREEILSQYYDPYHQLLTSSVDEKLERFGKCLIIDGHSFYEKPLPYELDQNEKRPDICIGTDPFHTPKSLTSFLIKSFQNLGYKVSVNTPFAGAIVPLKHYQNNKNVLSVMIEINRKLYIDENANKVCNYLKLKKDLSDILLSLPFSECTTDK